MKTEYEKYERTMKNIIVCIFLSKKRILHLSEIYEIVRKTPRYKDGKQKSVEGNVRGVLQAYNDFIKVNPDVKDGVYTLNEKNDYSQ